MAKYWNVFLILALLCTITYIALEVYNPKTTTWIERLVAKWTNVRELPPGVTDDLSSAKTIAANDGNIGERRLIMWRPTERSEREPQRDAGGGQAVMRTPAQKTTPATQVQAPKEKIYYRVTRGTKPVRDPNPPHRPLYFLYTIHTWECSVGKKTPNGARKEKEEIPAYIRERPPPNNRFNKHPPCCGGYPY